MPTGLMSRQVGDREWMVVDVHGDALTQRELPRMALIVPHIDHDALVVTAPRMSALRLPLARTTHGAVREVTIWSDILDADDCGEEAAQWFSAFLGEACRLVRFDPAIRRQADTQWTDGVEATHLFADGFPVLVLGDGSLADLNQRLIANGRAALPMQRFRPNIVIGDLPAGEEDFARHYRIGDVLLKPVKPCPRCPMPSIDQTRGEFGPDPLDILQSYRTNPRVDNGITFGMNAILLQGEGQSIHVGQPVHIEPDF